MHPALPVAASPDRQQLVLWRRLVPRHAERRARCAHFSSVTVALTYEPSGEAASSQSLTFSALTQGGSSPCSQLPAFRSPITPRPSSRSSLWCGSGVFTATKMATSLARELRPTNTLTTQTSSTQRASAPTAEPRRRSRPLARSCGFSTMNGFLSNGSSPHSPSLRGAGSTSTCTSGAFPVNGPRCALG